MSVVTNKNRLEKDIVSIASTDTIKENVPLKQISSKERKIKRDTLKIDIPTKKDTKKQVKFEDKLKTDAIDYVKKNKKEMLKFVFTCCHSCICEMCKKLKCSCVVSDNDVMNK